MTSVFQDVVIADPGQSGAQVDVTIEDSVISAIQPAGSTGHHEVIASGGWLAPGLIDGHVHFKTGDYDTNVILALHYLAHGITGVLCMDGSPAVLTLRDQIARHQVAGPRIWTTGPIQNDPELSHSAGLKVAADHAALTYDGVKVYNDLSADGLSGLLTGAQAAGLPVVGHVVRAAGLEQTLRSGQSHIAHLEEFVYTKLGLDMDRLMDARPLKLDLDAVGELASVLLETRQTVGTTIEALVAAFRQVRDVDAWCRRPDASRLPRSVTDPWQPPGNFYANTFSDARHGRAFQRLVRLAGGMAVSLRAAGVPLVVGSDALNCGVAPGSSLWRELRHLVRAGLSDTDAMRAAVPLPLTTGDALPRRVEVGADAELMLVAGGDPYQSVAHLGSVRGVFCGGQWRTSSQIWRQIRSATQRLDAGRSAPGEAAYSARCAL